MKCVVTLYVVYSFHKLCILRKKRAHQAKLF